jgi:hypothetical protein
MSTLDNQANSHDNRNENYNFLPQPLFPDDLDFGLRDYIEGWNLSLYDGSTGSQRKVPLIMLTQELWAERKLNWKFMRNEDGQEVSPPYMVLVRKNIVQGTEPIKRNIPLRKTFKYLKVPSFDGTTKGFDYYKIPQAVRIDLLYDLKFVSAYMEDVNAFYHQLHKSYVHGQGYMAINGYQIRSILDGDPSEDNQNGDLMNERLFRVNSSIRLHGKIIDPQEFEKVRGIKKIKFNMQVVNRIR